MTNWKPITEPPNHNRWILAYYPNCNDPYYHCFSVARYDARERKIIEPIYSRSKDEQVGAMWCDFKRPPGFYDQEESNVILLDALKRAVDLYGKEGGPWNVPSQPGSWIVQAKEAIAKVEGGDDE